jgi:nicotinate-nucleotide adenylyltransferase
MTLILSADAFLGLMTWRDPRRVLELARFAVAPRDGYPEAGPGFLATNLPDLADRAVFLDGPRIRLSASNLRERAAAGRSLRYLVPDAVAAYIGDHALYRTPRRNDQT